MRFPIPLDQRPGLNFRPNPGGFGLEYCGVPVFRNRGLPLGGVVTGCGQPREFFCGHRGDGFWDDISGEKCW